MGQCLSKFVVCCRWRTALIIRELEEEIVALEKGIPFRRKLKALLKKKEIIGAVPSLVAPAD